MVKFAFAIAGFVVDAIVNDPVLLCGGIDINAVYDTDAFDKSMSIATVLTINEFYFVAVVFV